MAKMSLSKEQLEKEMETKSIRQIARETGNTSLNYWVEKWELTPKYLKVKDQVLSKYQESIIIGSLFGDGNLDKIKDTIYFRETHCEKQFEYISWKFESLKNLTHKELRRDKNGKYHYALGTHKFTNTLYPIFYRHKVRILPANAEELLNPFSLAVWFMDDGTKNSKHSVSIATHKYGLSDHERLVEIFQNNFGITAVIQPCKIRGNQMYYLRFNKVGSTQLSNLIEPYIVPSMRYKIITD